MSEKEVLNVIFKIKGGGFSKDNFIERNIFCSEWTASRMQQWDMRQGGFFPIFCYWHWPWRPSALPWSLRGLDQGQILKLNLFRLSKTSSERIYSPQAVAKLGLPGQVHFPEPQSTHCWQHPAGHFPWTLNIRFPQPPASFSVSLIFLSRVLAGCRFSNNCTRRDDPREHSQRSRVLEQYSFLIS